MTTFPNLHVAKVPGSYQVPFHVLDDKELLSMVNVLGDIDYPSRLARPLMRKAPQLFKFGGAAMLYRTAVHRGRLIGFVILLTALQIFGTFFFPPPPSDRAAATTALVLYVVLALIAWWVERGRPAQALSSK